MKDVVGQPEGGILLDEVKEAVEQFTSDQNELFDLSNKIHGNLLKKTETLLTLVKDIEQACDEVCKIRNAFDLKKVDKVSVNDFVDVQKRGTEIVSKMLNLLEKEGFDIENMEPGHGLGHILRDFTNGLSLVKGFENKIDPKELFIGYLGGVFHDIGCTVVRRFEEKSSPIKHGEVIALMVKRYGKSIGLNEAEVDLLSYVVAAHTHYLAPQKVSYNGKEYVNEPYQDLDENGLPIYMVWIPRWIDRLDCSGPTIVGRHMFTLLHDHSDFDGKGFYQITLADHLRPIKRNNEEIKQTGGKRTMLEHLEMYANSQTNSSPYGKHDFGVMVELRDLQRERLKRIIEAVAQAGASENENCGISDEEKEQVFQLWENFLAKNIEPDRFGKMNASNLMEKFRQLPEKHQRAWVHGMKQTFVEFENYAEKVKLFLKSNPDQDSQYPFLKNIDILEVFSL